MTAPSSSPTTTDVPPPAREPAAGSSASRTGVREDLRGYADLGGFTLTPETHAWYAAADTVATSEEARAASTVLAEVRAALPLVREGAARLDGTPLGEPHTVQEAREAVALLLRVRDTLAVLAPAVYEEPELDALVAATAGRAWRKDRDVKLSWTQRRALRGRARELASGRRVRREALHSALASAASERTDWAALAAEGSRPALPEDHAFLEETARAAESAVTGLRELGRLLRPEQDLAAAPFGELADLLDRLASDEGTLYRLPQLRALRDGLRERGHGDLLADLAARRADAAEAVAAYEALEGTGGERAKSETVPAQAASAASEVAEESAAEVAAPAAAEPEAETATETETETETETAVAAAAEEKAEAEPEAEEKPEAAEEQKPSTAADEPTDTTEADTAEAAEAEAVEAEAARPEEPEAEPAPEAKEAATEPTAADLIPEPEPAEADPDTEPEPEAPASTPDTEPEPEPEPEAAKAPAAEPAPEAVTTPEAAPDPTPAKRRPRRPRKPAIEPGRPVTAYSHDELVALVRWIDGDAEERTDDELLRAAMKELGFARLGPRIKEALGAAVTEVRG